MTPKEICLKAIPIVKKTGTFIHDQLGKVREAEVEEKALNSLVSFVDKTAESQLVDQLGKLLPRSTFLTEEDTVDNIDSDLQWIIDPLDGTTNFLFQLPVFSVSVALREKGEIILGIVYEVNRKECFYAWKAGGAYLNEEKIRVSQRSPLANSLLATGFPYYDYEKVQPYLKVLEHFMKNTRGIRRFGSAAVDLAYTACGRFDGFYEYSLNAWDVAGGAFIVREAGGLVTDFKGEDNYLFGGDIIAGNPDIQKEILQTIQAEFKKDR